MSRCGMYAYVSYLHYILYFRGDSFRLAFAEIGTLRSLLPNSVNVSALTATATKATMDCIVEKLSLKCPEVIGLPPNRKNIKYIVKRDVTFQDFCSNLVDDLIKWRIRMQKTVLLCTTLQECVNIYSFVKKRLRPKITEPPGVPNILQFRLVDMFTAGSTTDMRENILAEFCQKDTKLRLIIASSAFGLGVDCPDITHIINWGPPATLEDLLQQSGRAGRDGTQSEAIFYYRKAGKNTTKCKKDYGLNESVCRRCLLYNGFLFSVPEYDIPLCLCCDICSFMYICQL